MLASYAPVLIFLLIAGGFGVLLLVLGFALGRGTKDSSKLAP
jgi:NADH:ubiquinone oxidoreductase subunit 3 (subunit A)